MRAFLVTSLASALRFRANAQTITYRYLGTALRLTLAAAFFVSAPGASAQTMRAIDLSANDLVYDPFSAKIYASVPSSAGSSGNSLVAVDPATGTVGSPVPIGSEPNKLAVSDDGQFLYVGLDGENAIRRFNLKTQTAEPSFSITDKYTAYTAGAMAVLPAHSHAIAVTRHAVGTGLSNSGVILYGTASPDRIRIRAFIPSTASPSAVR